MYLWMFIEVWSKGAISQSRTDATPRMHYGLPLFLFITEETSLDVEILHLISLLLWRSLHMLFVTECINSDPLAVTHRLLQVS